MELNTRGLELSPSLPQKDNFALQAEREAQLLVSRQIYTYSATGLLPMPLAGKVAAAIQAVDAAKWLVEWVGNQAATLANLELWKLQTSGQPLATFADYAKVFRLFPRPNVIETWMDDRIFAAQRLAGLNPLAINLVTADASAGIGWPQLAPRLSPRINDQVFESFPGLGLGIQETIRQRRLYVTDFSSLQPAIPSGEFPLAPIALYVKTGDFQGLQPAAIQLSQDPSDPHVYLASEGRQPAEQDRWLMAKFFLQCADLSQNQVVNHLTFTHLVEEGFALAMHRHLALQHPLYRLLNNHFTALMVINQIGMLTLINQGGLIDQVLQVRFQGAVQLIKNAYQNWTFDDLSFPGGLHRRGVNDSAALPYYPYRDDGMLIWDRLGSYINEYIALYYLGDDDVTADYELQSWARQLAGASDDGAGKLPGFPAQVTTRAQLGEILRRIIWTAGPQHAAVNFPQVDFTSFVPNAPGLLAAPISNPANESDLVTLLPNKAVTEVQVKLSYALAGLRYDQLLDYHLDRGDGSEALVRKYQNELGSLDRPEIIRRNQLRAAQAGLLIYPYFLPENIPNSTSV
jgi:arachidonate 15-lipoxygenase